MRTNTTTMLTNMSRCKCTKSDVKMSEENAPYFESMTAKLEERRCDLIGRQRELREKITTMERSIPALMAYNMWMAGQKCEDAPYCKVREIMNQFSPYPDPTERLLESLRATLKELNGETAELHEKIIDADVKLEETNMQLESLELANREMDDTLNSLEKEVRDHATPSLHSIHSDDLICLSKIRQLGREELNLKSCIKELEKKEAVFREQIDRLLTSKDFQKICEGKRMVKCIKEFDGSERRTRCATQIHNQSVHHLRKRRGQKDNEPARVTKSVTTTSSRQNAKAQQSDQVRQEKSEDARVKRSSWITSWWKSSRKSSEPANEVKKVEKSVPAITDENDIAISCICPPSPPTQYYERQLLAKQMISSKASKSEKTGSPCTSCKSRSCCSAMSPQVQTIGKSCSCTYSSTQSVLCKKSPRSSSKPKIACPKIPLSELSPCNPSEIGFRQSCKPSTRCATVYRDPKNPCKIRRQTVPCTVSPVVGVGSCRCNCKGKCSRGLSSVPCSCGESPSCPSDKGYQPLASRTLDANSRAEDSNSEEEFCECCSCGCDDSDVSVSCQCDENI